MIEKALTSSESNEWYTPARYVEIVRKFFGGEIDLDPCSSIAAQRTVKANMYFSLNESGEDALKLPWYAKNVFMNPPYGKVANESQAGLFCRELLLRHSEEQFAEAVILINSCTGAKWFQPLFDESICFVDHRIHYDVPPGSAKKSQPTKDNVFVYVGNRVVEFQSHFKELGRIRIASKHIERYINGRKR
jgi:hypothetical protein